METEGRGAGSGKEEINRSNFPSWLRLTNSLENESFPDHTQLDEGLLPNPLVLQSSLPQKGQNSCPL